MGIASVPKISTMSAEGRGVILERMDLMAGTASLIMTLRRVMTPLFSLTRPVRSGEGMSMMWQRDEFNISVSVFEVWEVTARTVTWKLW